MTDTWWTWWSSVELTWIPVIQVPLPSAMMSLSRTEMLSTSEDWETTRMPRVQVPVATTMLPWIATSSLDKLKFCHRAGKKARRTYTNEQRQHNKPARLAKSVATCPAKVRSWSTGVKPATVGGCGPVQNPPRRPLDTIGGLIGTGRVPPNASVLVHLGHREENTPRKRDTSVAR